MPRVRLTFLTALLTGLLAAAFAVGPASAAGGPWSSLSSARVAAANPADNLAGDGTEPADEADPPDDATEIDLGDLCLPTDGTAADDPAADDTQDPVDETDTTAPDDGTSAGAEPVDEADPADDPTDGECAGEDDPGATKDGGTKDVLLADILKSGEVDVGGVSLDGPGTITEELTMTQPGGATTRIVAFAASSKPSRKPASKGKAPKKIMAGRAVKVVKKAGVVHVKVRLTGVARKILKAAKKDVRITVKTTVKPKKGKAKTRKGTIVVKVKVKKK